MICGSCFLLQSHKPISKKIVIPVLKSCDTYQKKTDILPASAFFRQDRAFICEKSVKPAFRVPSFPVCRVMMIAETFSFLSCSCLHDMQYIIMK